MQDVSRVGQWKINETEYFTFPQNVHDQENKTVCGNHESRCGSYIKICLSTSRLFGFPEHYTDVGQLNLNTRRRLLGKSWVVDVIKHILAPLKQYFVLREP